MRSLIAVVLLFSGCVSQDVLPPQDRAALYPARVPVNRPIEIKRWNLDNFTCENGTPLRCDAATRTNFLCVCRPPL